MLKLEKSKKNQIINILNSAIKWKNAVDEVVSFSDGNNIPSILVENKVDLLKEDTQKYKDFIDFSKENKFCGCFRTSVKTGLNVPESFKFLLNNIISRMKNMEKTKEMITFDPSTDKF